MGFILSFFSFAYLILSQSKHLYIYHGPLLYSGNLLWSYKKILKTLTTASQRIKCQNSLSKAMVQIQVFCLLTSYQVRQFIIQKVKSRMDYLYCPCPVSDCPNPDKSARYWYHAGCGSRTQIRFNDIYIICSGCKASAIMFDWMFKCAAHGYKHGTKQGFLYALAIMGQQRGNEDQIKAAVTRIMLNW